jgi:hypothetical protein
MAIPPIDRLSAAVPVGRGFELRVARHVAMGRSAGQHAQ